MSTYHNTCHDCGDTYTTESWEPSQCPFCEVEKSRHEIKKLRERVESLCGTVNTYSEKLGLGKKVNAKDWSEVSPLPRKAKP